MEECAHVHHTQNVGTVLQLLTIVFFLFFFSRGNKAGLFISRAERGSDFTEGKTRQKQQQQKKIVFQQLSTFLLTSHSAQCRLLAAASAVRQKVSLLLQKELVLLNVMHLNQSPYWLAASQHYWIHL